VYRASRQACWGPLVRRHTIAQSPSSPLEQGASSLAVNMRLRLRRTFLTFLSKHGIRIDIRAAMQCETGGKWLIPKGPESQHSMSRDNWRHNRAVKLVDACWRNAAETHRARDKHAWYGGNPAAGRTADGWTAVPQLAFA
jgi:hypothetical protein